MDQLSFGFSIRLRYATLVIGILLTLALVTYHAANPSNNLQSLSSIAGACIAATALAYAAISFNFSQMMKIIEIKQIDRAAAVNLICQFNSPHMVKAIRINIHQRQKLSTQTGIEVVQLFEQEPEKYEAAICVLNYLEMVSLFVKHDTACEEILRDFFSVTVQTYWRVFTPWIMHRRASVSPDLFSELEWLATRWFSK